MADRELDRETQWALVALGELLARPIRWAGCWLIPPLLWIGVMGGVEREARTFGASAVCGLLIGALLERAMVRRRRGAAAGVLLLYVIALPCFYVAVDPLQMHSFVDTVLASGVYTTVVGVLWARQPASRTRAVVTALGAASILALVGFVDRWVVAPVAFHYLMMVLALMGLSELARVPRHGGVGPIAAVIFACGVMGLAPTGLFADGPRALAWATAAAAAGLVAGRVQAEPLPDDEDLGGILAAAFQRHALWLVPVVGFMATAPFARVQEGALTALFTPSLPFRRSPLLPVILDWYPNFGWLFLVPVAVVPTVLAATLRATSMLGRALPVLAAAGCVVALAWSPLGAGYGALSARPLVESTAGVVLPGLSVALAGGLGLYLRRFAAAPASAWIACAAVGIGVGLMPEEVQLDQPLSFLGVVALLPVLACLLTGATLPTRTMVWIPAVLAALVGGTRAALGDLPTGGPGVWLTAPIGYALLGAVVGLGAAAGRRVLGVTVLPVDHPVRTDFSGPELPALPEPHLPSRRRRRPRHAR